MCMQRGKQTGTAAPDDEKVRFVRLDICHLSPLPFSNFALKLNRQPKLKANTKLTATATPALSEIHVR